MLTSKLKRDKKGVILHVDGKPTPQHLRALRIPPAWKNLIVNTDPEAALVAIGTDAKGRKQFLYSPEHIKDAKERKFRKVRELIEQHEDIRTEIEEDINNPDTPHKYREAAILAYLIYETGIRPGSNAETLGDVKAYGATTLQLRHIKPAKTGVHLKFIGKKGVANNLKVTNPFLVEELKQRKEEGNSYYGRVFECSSSTLNNYVKGLGTGGFTPKDLRTMRANLIALDLVGWRVRVPKTKKGKKEICRNLFKQVAKRLGNTPAVAKSAYVDPAVYERFLPERN